MFLNNLIFILEAVDEGFASVFELVKLQVWIKSEGFKVVVIFEAHDAAGKGAIIKRITASL